MGPSALLWNWLSEPARTRAALAAANPSGHGVEAIGHDFFHDLCHPGQQTCTMAAVDCATKSRAR